MENENMPQHSSVYWIEVGKISPNPFQPRREFDPEKLRDLSESIKLYGILQPLVVTRKEITNEFGSKVEYELVAGERRLRASKLAGVSQVPVIVKREMSDKVKLELAIIENLQREDLNSVERALAFRQLVDEFKLKHHEVGSRVGKSRVFVSNTLRILSLPDDIQQGIRAGKITEGHSRPLLMLTHDREEQSKLYDRIIETKMTVREAERASRLIAQNRAKRNDTFVDGRTREMENKLSEMLGTRVHIEKMGDSNSGKIRIDFFSEEELSSFIEKVAGSKDLLNNFTSKEEQEEKTEVFSEDNNTQTNQIEIVDMPSMDGSFAKEEDSENCDVCDVVNDFNENNDDNIIISESPVSSELEPLEDLDELIRKFSI